MEEKKKRILLFQLATLILVVYVALQVSAVVNPPMEMAPTEFDQQSENEMNKDIS